MLWLSAVGILGTALGLLLTEDPDGDEASRWGLSNPLAIDPVVADGFLAVTFMLVIVTLMAAAWSLLLRFRQSYGAERQRIKWVVYGGALAVPLWIVGGTFLDETAAGAVLAGLAMTVIPLSIAVAILRYRLYDIDQLISRTVGYALVAGLLAGLYASITVGLPRCFPSRWTPLCSLPAPHWQPPHCSTHCDATCRPGSIGDSTGPGTTPNRRSRVSPSSYVPR